MNCKVFAKFLPWVLGLFLVPVAAAADPEIHNGAQPAQPGQTMPMAELWRIGGPDDDENLLGVINEVFRDDSGRLYLLDIQLTEVLVYDEEGQYVQSLGQRGDGPGELRYVTDALLLPDGTVGLVQPFPGKIVKVDRNGVPAGEVRPGGDDPTKGGFFAMRTAASVNDHLVISGLKISRGENSRTATHFIGQLGLDGSEGHHFRELVNVREFGRQKVVELDEFFPHENGWALAPDGSVVIVPARNEYRLEVHAAGGEPRLSFSREYTSVKRTDVERERAEAMMMPWRRRNRASIEFVMEPTEPDVLQLHVADDGRIWVLPSRGVRDQAAGVHSTWDVFTPDGVFERQVAMACDANGLQDAMFFPGGDLVVVIKEHEQALWAFQARGADDPGAETGEGEANPLEVICYRIAPSLGRATD
jgi:hypothetical protein